MKPVLGTLALTLVWPILALAQVDPTDPRNQPRDVPVVREFPKAVPGQPSARVRLLNEHTWDMQVRHIPGHGPGKTCEKRYDYAGARPLGGAGSSTGLFRKRTRESIGMPMGEPPPDTIAFREIAIPAADMMALEVVASITIPMGMGYSTSTCKVMMGFVPAAGHDYELALVPDPQKGTEGCGIRFLEWSIENGKAAAKPAAYERLSLCR